MWPRALGLLLPTVALSTFVNMQGMCKIGRWTNRWRLTVSDRNVNVRKTLLWQPWRWMATKFLTSVWRVTSTIVAEAKLMSYFRWWLMAEPDDWHLWFERPFPVAIEYACAYYAQMIWCNEVVNVHAQFNGATACACCLRTLCPFLTSLYRVCKGSSFTAPLPSSLYIMQCT